MRRRPFMRTEEQCIYCDAYHKERYEDCPLRDLAVRLEDLRKWRMPNSPTIRRMRRDLVYDIRRIQRRLRRWNLYFKIHIPLRVRKSYFEKLMAEFPLREIRVHVAEENK